MTKLFDDQLFDDGLNTIVTAAAGPNLKLVLTSEDPTTRAGAATLHDGGGTNVRVSDEIAIASGDVTLQDRAGGGREIVIAAKSGTVAINIPTIDSGTATSGGAATLTDTGKAFTVNEHTDKILKLTGGTGSGQSQVIASNTATVITVVANWTTNPDATTTYEILEDLHYAMYDATDLFYVSDETSNQALTLSNPINMPSFSFGMADPI